jgi:hypothetical protein
MVVSVEIIKYNSMHILGKTMASHFFGRSDGCRGDLGPRPPGIHFTHSVINLPIDDRSRIHSKHSNILSLCN